MAMPETTTSSSMMNHRAAAARTVSVLASCYVVDAAGCLKGLHYSTTGASGLPSPPSSPPLAALSSSNELRLLPKSTATGGSGAGQLRSAGGRQKSASSVAVTGRRSRGGAALSIREECERFFCGSMSVTFYSEKTSRAVGPVLVGAGKNSSTSRRPLVSAMSPRTPSSDASDDDYEDDGNTVDNNRRLGINNNNNDDDGNPELDGYFPQSSVLDGSAVDTDFGCAKFGATAWMEIWDYVGGASFRAFVADNGAERSLFTFFDLGVVGSRDLKQALVALIELAEGPLECSNIVLCLDRRMPAVDAQSLLRSLQWVGFEATTLDRWAHDMAIVSRRWLFVEMEL